MYAGGGVVVVMSDFKVIVKAPINIALIKYWGKVDEDQVIPCNDSISMTIDSSELLTITTVQADPNLDEDQFVLNGQIDVTMNKRIQSTILKVRFKAKPSEMFLKF